MPRLDPDRVEALEEKITAGEVLVAISQLNNGKTPGSHGFPVEFDKCVTSKVVKPMLSMFNTGGPLPPGLGEATIVLIHREVKVADDCTSDRLISLINRD
ncbi:hypothetical protein NDU88_007139 [Pleurodeles waltl]|uniref:Uncharacterized protein n=1 Tax=Pleurodeles waltl TaxID=8319 RepID=A0AAV7PPD3_PLEWA|nr:hypothetical protein NDU88_007139 [Pleurodeles waltl]